MKKTYSIILFALALGATHLRAADYYIAPSGDDANPGTSAAPFATLTRARDAIRALKQGGGLPVGGVTVWLRSGSYPLSSTVVFDSRDSGTVDRPVVYSAAPGEEVYISGGRGLDPTWFSPVTSSSPLWSRLDSTARAQIQTVNLAAHGITHFGALKPRGYGIYSTGPLELFADGKPMTLARWPNASETLARTVTAPSARQITYSGTRPSRWTQATDVWLHGFWSVNWADFHVPLAAIDTGARQLTFASEPLHFGTSANRPYYVYNLVEELDEPGEYYVDRANATLYYWPAGPLANSRLQVSMMEGALLVFSDVQHIKLRDLVIEASRGALVDVQASDNFRAERCLFRNAGSYAVQMTGTNNGVDQCEIVDCGDDGVRIAGGTRATLEAGNNYVTNSRFRRLGRTGWSSKPGVYLLGGSGNRVARNTFEEMPHSAIIFGGNNHVMELNEIQRVCQLTSDAGAIYSGRDWGYRGNIIRHNFIHSLQTKLGTGVNGIYLDDCVSGVQVFGNIFYKIANTAVECGGGRDNIITNNLIADCGWAHYNDDRGRDQINNIAGDSWNLGERLRAEGINYQTGAWAAAFPASAAIPTSWAAIQAGLWRNPQGTVFASNAGWGNTGWALEVNSSGTGVFAVYASMANNQPGHAPLFFSSVLLSRGLRPAAVTANINGFQPIPFNSIGPEQVTTSSSSFAPSAPTLSGSVTTAQIDLRWSFSTLTAGLFVDGFGLERRNLPDGAWLSVQTLGAESSFTSLAGVPAGTSYAFRLRVYNAVGSVYSNEVSLTTPDAPLVVGTATRFEAESSLNVRNDVGNKGSVGVTNAILDSGSSVRLFDPGDEIRISFSVPSTGTYRIGARMRAGQNFWPSGYRFTLDGSTILLSGDAATVSALDPSYGPTIWGTMYSDTLTLSAGTHTLDVAAAADWGVADYIEVAPLTPPQVKTFAEWQRAHFSADQASDTAVSDWLAAPLSPSFPNLLKYALGLDPWKAVTGAGVTTTVAGGRSQLVFRRPAGLLDVSYTVEVSENLVTWTPVSLVTIDQSGGFETLQGTAATPAQSFIRLRVTAGSYSAATAALRPGAGSTTRYEAENGLIVVNDVGGNGSIGVSDGIFDSGQSVRLYDVGDTIRINVPLVAGKYRIGIRVRSGGTVNSVNCWPDGYLFKLDGAPLPLVGDPLTVSAWDASYGGAYWGTMYGEITVSSERVGTFDITANRSWVVADYLEITPLN